MAKPEWGLKRACQGCGARYYDLLRAPPVCPHCGAEFIAEPIGRRRSQAAVPAPQPASGAAPKPAGAADADKSGDGTGGDAEDENIEDGGDSSGLMEDTDGLSEDEEDVAEVKEHIEDDGGDKSA